MMLMAAATAFTFSSCSDDDNLGDAPRLFRPIASLDVSRNNLIVTWDKIKEADEYTLELYKLTDAGDEAGTTDRTLLRTEICPKETTTFTFSDLEWDEKYEVAISCKNSGKESEKYLTSSASITYFSKIKSVKAIDNAVRITWAVSDNADIIRKIQAVPVYGPETADEDKAETLTIDVSESDNLIDHIDIAGLSPETKYTFYTYKDAETLDNSTYAGKISATTTAKIDFDASYGEGNWIDIRSWDDADTLRSAEFMARLTEGMTVILRGDFDYKVGKEMAFDKSVHFVTGPTLGGNARFISSSAMGCAKNATVDHIIFEDIDFYGGTNVNVATCTDKGFGGKQVFNENGTASTLNSIVFRNCNIEYYRAVVRVQSKNDNILSIEMDNCTVNGIGDQGVVTTTNNAADYRSVSLNNCTFTNIVMMCDLRATAQALKFDVNQCTFCYAPMETTANANTPLFRIGKNDNVELNITSSLFGPSMATEGSSGSKLITYTAGPKGSIFLDYQDGKVGASKSFKTNFAWTEIGDAAKTYPIASINSLDYDEKKLWMDPENGDFTVIATIEGEIPGATKWIR